MPNTYACTDANASVLRKRADSGGSASMAGLAFEVLVDDTLAGITSVSQLTGLINKRVLSLINDFEDAEWRYPEFQKLPVG